MDVRGFPCLFVPRSVCLFLCMSVCDCVCASVVVFAVCQFLLSKEGSQQIT